MSTKTKIQCLWFRKDKWTEKDAIVWCDEHEFKADDFVDQPEHYLFRQFPPAEGVEYRTIADDFPEGVSATIAILESEKQMKLTFKSGEQSSEDKFTYVMSTESVDRMNDVIEQNWVLDHFKKNPIALWNHNYSNPIGVWENVKVVKTKAGKQLVGTLKLAKEGTSELIDTVRSLVAQGILRAVSVGFNPIEFTYDKEIEGYRFKKVELWECSLVSVPANAEALQVVKGLDLKDKGIINQLFAAPGTPADRPNVLQKNAATGKNKSHQGKKPMKISDKIVAAQEEIKGATEALEAIKKNIEDNDRDPTDEETTQIEHYSEVIEEKTKSVDSLKVLEKAMARNADSGRSKQSDMPTAFAKASTEKKDDIFIKMATAHLCAHLMTKNVDSLVDEMYSNDSRVQAVLRAAVNPATTTTAGWAAELVQTSIQGFMEELRGESAYAQIAPLGTALVFGANGSISVPGWGGSGTDLAGSFVAEGAAIPVKKGTLTSKAMNRYKMAVISTFTKEIIRSSVPQIESLVRQKIREDTAQAIDNALLDAAAASAGVRPASILNGAPTQAATGTGSAADVITDMTWLYSQINANAGRRMVLLLHPRRVAGLSMKTNAAGAFMFRSDVAAGNLLGARLIQSTHIPVGTIVLMDAADFASAFDIPDFEVSDVATIVEASDVAPAPVVGPVSGAAGTTPPTTVRSLFQTWSTALRMVMPLSWAKMRTDTLAYITAAAW